LEKKGIQTLQFPSLVHREKTAPLRQSLQKSPPSLRKYKLYKALRISHNTVHHFAKKGGKKYIVQTGVVILNWNAAKETIACVESIKAWSSTSPNIYVVDNNSSKDDQDILIAHRHKFNLIKNTVNKGFSGGNNIGIKAALADNNAAILLLNNDARMAEKDLYLLLNTLASSREIGVIGPVLYDYYTNELQNAGGKDIGWNYISHLTSLPEKEKVYDVDYVSGTAMLVRSEVFKTIGLFDERYFFSGEVADFCQRVYRYKGPDGFRFKVTIHPGARATHNLKTSSYNREKLYTYYTVRNRYLYIRKFLRIYLPVLYVFWIYKHLKHAFASYKIGKHDVMKVIMRGLVHGLVGRVGPINGTNTFISSGKK